MFKNEYVKGVCQILQDQNTLVVERATRILFVLMIGNSQRNVEPLLTPPSPSTTCIGGRKSTTTSFSVAKIQFPYEASPDSLVTMIMSLTSSVQGCYSHLMQADAMHGESENRTYVLYSILNFGTCSICTFCCRRICTPISCSSAFLLFTLSSIALSTFQKSLEMSLLLLHIHHRGVFV